MTSLTDSSKSKIAWGLLLAALLLFLWRFAAVLSPFGLSLVLAYVLKPTVESLVKKRVPRVLAVTLCVLLSLLVVLTLLVLLVPIVSQLVPMLKAQTPDLLARTWTGLLPHLAQLGLEVPSLEEGKALLVNWINAHASQWAGTILSSVLIGGSGVMTALGFLLMVPMLAFYWLMDWDEITRRTWHLLPPRWRPAVHGVLTECDGVMGQFLRGQVLVMLILAAWPGSAWPCPLACSPAWPCAFRTWGLGWAWCWPCWLGCCNSARPPRARPIPSSRWPWSMARARSSKAFS